MTQRHEPSVGDTDEDSAARDPSVPAPRQPAPAGGGPATVRDLPGLKALPGSLLRLRELSVVVVVIVLILYFGFANSAFFSSSNLGNVANFGAAAAIIAAGEVFLLICGEIDLSTGMTFALTPFVMMSVNDAGVPMLISVIVGLVVAAAIGVFNGLVNQLLRLPSFITTLGMLYLLHGITLKVSNNFPRPAPTQGVLTEVLGGYKWSELIWAVALAVLMQVVLTQTRWGAHTIATGANSLGAAEAGIRTRWVKIRAFMIASTFAGLGGILDGTHISHSFDPNAGGNDLMFEAVAACVIGGTALLGGSGTVVGAFFGALLLAVLQDGFNIQGINATTFIVIEGVAILIAMVLNTQLARLRRGVKGG
ncbi:ABC transporter permease subunit [Streptomyces sp. DW26H14]|uniref:ABC transporter permease subunit n=1 Tax=Streptomyces sp. DW26H14 TaxID=3435395 RepID=UPI00403DF03E